MPDAKVIEIPESQKLSEGELTAIRKASNDLTLARLDVAEFAIVADRLVFHALVARGLVPTNHTIDETTGEIKKKVGGQ